jgi:hypothetical protein
MRFSLCLFLLTSACASPLTQDPQSPNSPLTIADLWATQAFSGLEVTITEAQITSGRLANSPSFYAQDAASETPLGLRVDLHGLVNHWPPTPGTLVELTGVISYVDDAPRLAMAANEDGLALGSAEIAYNTSPETPLHGLVRLDALRVSSRPDPSGRADTDTELDLESAFGVALPDWDNLGQLTGVITSPGRVSLRTPEDWSGTWEEAIAPTTTLSEIRAGAFTDGSPVYVETLQATPFSRDGRWAVLQDEDGAGLWLDTAHWELDRPEQGALGTWLVEVREDGQRLHGWNSPSRSGSDDPAVTTEPLDGALLVETLETLDEPDATGERSSEVYLIDDRFIDTTAWSAPLTVQGALWLPPGATQPILCPVQSL